MSRGTKVFVGLLSFLPIILLIAFFLMFLFIIPSLSEWDNGYEPTVQEVFTVFGPIFILAIVMGILSLGLLVFFIMHLVRNNTIDTTERIIWVLVFLFAGLVGYPIYWYMRIWKDDKGPL